MVELVAKAVQEVASQLEIWPRDLKDWSPVQLFVSMLAVPFRILQAHRKIRFNISPEVMT